MSQGHIDERKYSSALFLRVEYEWSASRHSHSVHREINRSNRWLNCSLGTRSGLASGRWEKSLAFAGNRSQILLFVQPVIISTGSSWHLSVYGHWNTAQILHIYISSVIFVDGVP